MSNNRQTIRTNRPKQTTNFTQKTTNLQSEEKVTFNDGAMTIKMQQLSREKYLEYYRHQLHPALLKAPKPFSK